MEKWWGERKGATCWGRENKKEEGGSAGPQGGTEVILVEDGENE